MKDKTKKVQFFSQETQRLYQLYGEPATLKISGVPMHRHTKMNPLQDTETKINSLKPHGIVLDTCTGLGYTAIFSSKLPEVKKVITIEKDENVIEIAKLNPYSQDLFENPKIEMINANSIEEIKKFKDNEFDTIIHDPPTFSISPDLYTLKFHIQLFRILKKDGELWHYSPQPGKLKKEWKEGKQGKQGSKLKERIMKQLKEAGFINVRYDQNSSGILAYKI